MTIRTGEYLAALNALPLVTMANLAGEGGIVVVAPHPDDESLGCGGLIAEAVASGRSVRIVVVSDGTGSHPNSVAWPSDRLRALREAESIEAARRLGVPMSAITFLRLPDCAVPDHGPNFDHAADGIRQVVQESGASALFATWRFDPHCDHRASFLMAEAAFCGLKDVSLYSFPVWGWRLPPDGVINEALPQGGRLPIERHLGRKRLAIEAHKSQLTDLIDDDPDGFRLDSAMLALFDRPFETFVECRR